MTQSPKPANQAEPPSHQRLRLLLLSRTGIALGVPVVVGLAGGVWWLLTFVQKDLAPLVQKNLTQTLKRPVQLGRIERFSLTGLRFGASSVPATPSDSDRASVKAVEVAFDPLQLLFTRTLKLDVALVEPDVYIEQDRQGRWVSIPAIDQKQGLIKTQLDTIELHNANVVLVPNPKTGNTKKPFVLGSVDGNAHLLEQNQLIQFQIAGSPATGGSLQIQGASRLKTQQTNLQLQVQSLLGSDVTRLIKLPLDLQAGRVDGNLLVQLRPNEPQPNIFGTVGLNAVTAKFNQLPQPFINSQGTLNFQKTLIGLSNVRTSYGKIAAIANGVLDTKGGFNLTARVNQATLANAQDTLKIKAPVPVTGVFQADLKVIGPILKPVLLGTFATTKPARVDRVSFSSIRSQFRFSTASSQITLKDIQAIPATGGKITGGGTITLGRKPGIALNASVQNVPGDPIARLYGVSPQIQVGTVTAEVQVSGIPTRPHTVVDWQAPSASYPASGVIIADRNNLLLRDTVLSVAGGTVQASGQLANGRWQASVQADGIQPARLAKVPPGLQAPLSGVFNLSGTTAAFKPETIRTQGSGRVNIAGGIIAANIQTSGGQWQALGTAAGVQLGRLLPQLPSQFRGTLRDGRFNLSGSLTAFNLQNIRGTAEGGVNVAGGTVTASNIQLANGQWRALGNAVDIKLGQLLPQLPSQFRGILRDGRFNLSGSLTAFNLQNIRGTAQGGVNLAGGTITASNIKLAQGEWQALGTATGVQLRRILPQLPSQFQGTLRDARFNLLGSLAKITPATVRGNVSGRLGVAGGTVTASNVKLANGRWQGSFTANEVQLGTLAKLVASNRRFSPRLQGRLNASINALGPLSGFKLAAIEASGQVRLLNLAAGSLNFDPVLSGQLNVTPQGVNLQLAGVQDRIELALSPTYRPISFFVQRDSAIATGRTQGDILNIQATKFPVSILQGIAPSLPSAIASQPASGELSGNLAINLNTFAAEGDVAIAQPALGTIKGDQLLAQFRYANGKGTLTSAKLTQGPSLYTLTGSFTQTSRGPEFQAAVNIAQGQIQSILTALQLYDLQDFRRGVQSPVYARAGDIQTAAVGLPKANLLTQLRRFSEIEAVVEQQQRLRDASPLPSLAQLKGAFDGQITVSGSLQNGLKANFNLGGDNWKWGAYTAEQVIAQGSYDKGVLTLVPLRIVGNLGGADAQTQTLLAFNGQVGGKQQSGQLRVRNFPVDVLKKFVRLPVDFTGLVNATATLAGSQTDPQAIGELSLAQGTLNQKPVESAQASFNYAQARLNFASNVVVSGPEPIAIIGSIPYKLPFASTQPSSNQIQLDVNVQNEGLALLNLLTNQVAWEGGQGRVQLQARGTMKQPLVTGIATVDNATISVQALPEPLTDVSGTARFDGNRIRVEGVQGKFSQGNVAAQGVIPIFANLEPEDADRANPLTVTLDRLALNLKGLYQGGASGSVVITGSALNPVIGGEVRLAQGNVLLAENGANALTPATLSGGSGGSGGDSSGAANKQLTPATNSAGVVPEFNNLQLTLGDSVRITRPPVLSFQATGTLTLNGTRNDILPNGTIRLRRGGVNIFTTQFNLARRYPQTATFSPSQGLNPTLNIRLVAAVPEVTRRRVPQSPSSAEVNEPLATNLGALQTVRVQATIQGPASQLFNRLELTSNPARSQSEIVALLGGGFVDTLGRGDAALGLANFASTALLGNFQGTVTNIGNALGLSELRLFPTVITSEDRSRSSTLGLAAEAGVDISRNISASAVKILTADQPTQFGVNYRLNNNVRLRTSTDFSGDTQATVEYENRF